MKPSPLTPAIVPRRWTLPLLSVVCSMNTLAAEPDFQSAFVAAGFSRSRSAFAFFSLDSLGKRQTALNPAWMPPATATNAPAVRLEKKDAGRFDYLLDVPGGQPVRAWSIECSDRELVLRSEFSPAAPLPAFTLTFAQKANYATLLGLMQAGERRMALPCVLHMPGMGSCRITGNVPGAKLDYDARRYVKTPFVHIEFPPATAQQPRVEYRLNVTAIHPPLAGIETDARFDGFRRDYLSIFQVNPRAQFLANNSASDPCAYTLFKYAEMARRAPPLADGLTCLDLVRMTLDRYLAGAKAFGLVGFTKESSGLDVYGWFTPARILDAYPSMVMTACIYAESSGDLPWARANYEKIAVWAREMMEGDKNGNGLIEYPYSGNLGDRPTGGAMGERRPANWWDTINFGHEDAYANALAFRACKQFAGLARKLGHHEDAAFFAAKAAKLRTAYVPAFLNPATGVLAGWRSADGQLHDYWFTFIQGVAITYGLVDDRDANRIMDRLLKKMADVGYTHFRLGLPGNLVPIPKADYILANTKPEWGGEPRLDDGSDGFQFYENGGATGCYVYFTLKALYQLGRVEDARRILYPMLEGYAAGEFQGFDKSGMSRDWKDWKVGGHGYEGLLVDNYLTLLAVFDEVQAGSPRSSGAGAQKRP
ncbi:MAG: hypothetical protein HZA91_01915 [Verrucomicrobia bacterium]|nr:hypothetical protein [Verrucomicrobiota bacterium]